MAEELVISPPEAEITPPQEPQVDVQASEPEEEAPPPSRRIKFVDNELSLPDGLPDEVYTKLEEINSSLNKGVTSKFQEAAALRRQIEAEREQVTEWRKQQESVISKNRQIAALELQLEQYGDVKPEDFERALNQAPDEDTRQRIRDIRMNVWESRNRLEQLRAEAEKTISAEKSKQAEIEARWTEIGNNVMKQAIKDWGPQKAELVSKTMRDYGVGQTTPELDRAAIYAASFHPAVTRAFHDAALYRQALSKATNAPADTTPVQPVQKVGGQAKSAKDPDKMSTEDWMKWRDADLKKNRR